MNDRRKFLAKLSGAATALVAAGVAGGAFTKKPTGALLAGGSQRGKLYGLGKMPEVKVQSSAGKTLRLYADLIKGKVVLINFMAIDNEKALPITGALLEIAKRLGSKFGTDVQFVSITSDPGRDTPARLQAFEKQMGVPRKGWTFVRMSAASSTIVASRLHRHSMAPMPDARIGVINYGNEPAGLWGLFPMSISADDAVLRIDSILSGRRVAGTPRRAGPRKLNAGGMPFNHRIA